MYLFLLNLNAAFQLLRLRCILGCMQDAVNSPHFVWPFASHHSKHLLLSEPCPGADPRHNGFHAKSWRQCQGPSSCTRRRLRRHVSAAYVAKRADAASSRALGLITCAAAATICDQVGERLAASAGGGVGEDCADSLVNIRSLGGGLQQLPAVTRCSFCR